MKSDINAPDDEIDDPNDLRLVFINFKTNTQFNKVHDLFWKYFHSDDESSWMVYSRLIKHKSVFKGIIDWFGALLDEQYFDAHPEVFRFQNKNDIYDEHTHYNINKQTKIETNY